MDSFARATARRAHEAASEIRKDIAALIVRLGVVEDKTAGFAQMGRCALCGEPTRGRYCRQHAELMEEE